MVDKNMDDKNFDTVLLAKLKIKKQELEVAFTALNKELLDVTNGIQKLCPHLQIVKSIYTFNYDSYSQTYDEGPTYKCEDCNLYERGYGGVLESKVYK